jgi:hypothetical protein
MGALSAVLPPSEEECVIASQAQLMRLLNDAAQLARRKCGIGLFDLVSDSGYVLSIAVGGDESVLNFMRADAEGDYYTSRGASNSEHPVFTAYYLFEHHSEFARNAVISMGDATLAAMEFLASGERPTIVRWQPA